MNCSVAFIYNIVSNIISLFPGCNQTIGENRLPLYRLLILFPDGLILGQLKVIKRQETHSMNCFFFNTVNLLEGSEFSLF